MRLGGDGEGLDGAGDGRGGACELRGGGGRSGGGARGRELARRGALGWWPWRGTRRAVADGGGRRGPRRTGAALVGRARGQAGAGRGRWSGRKKKRKRNWWAIHGTHGMQFHFTVFVLRRLFSELYLRFRETVLRLYSSNFYRSPGKIIDLNVPTFEALSQVGTARVTIKNIGKLEASYSLTFNCDQGINYVEEQFFIMKPDEVLARTFYLHLSTDQASKYRCTTILKASDFSEVDRAECQFTTTATVLDNGTQVGPPNQRPKGGIKGFIEAIKALWRNTWDSVIDFFTGRSCSTKCSSFFDLSCHIQYICIGWLVMFGLLLCLLPAVAVLLWLLHQNGLFDPLYDWWEDVFGPPETAHPKHGRGHHAHAHHHSRHTHAHKKRTSGVPGQHHHHHHHHVLHRHGGQPDAAGEQRHRHSPALGVQHRDGAHKHHRHGKAPQRERDGGGVEFKEQRGHRERHGDRERHHSRAV